MGLPNTSVKKYLRHAADVRKNTASEGLAHVKDGARDTAGLYTRMKKVADSKRLLSESAALRSIASSLLK